MIAHESCGEIGSNFSSKGRKAENRAEFNDAGRGDLAPAISSLNQLPIKYHSIFFEYKNVFSSYKIIVCLRFH